MVCGICRVWYVMWDMRMWDMSGVVCDICRVWNHGGCWVWDI